MAGPAGWFVRNSARHEDDPAGLAAYPAGVAWMIRLVLAIAVAQVAVWWQPAGPTPSALIALGTAALAAAVLAVLSQDYWPRPAITAGPLLRRAVALRRKSWSAAFQRQRNPDAAGRPRPRAPSAAPAAA